MSTRWDDFNKRSEEAMRRAYENKQNAKTISDITTEPIKSGTIAHVSYTAIQKLYGSNDIVDYNRWTDDMAYIMKCSKRLDDLINIDIKKDQFNLNMAMEKCGNGKFIEEYNTSYSLMEGYLSDIRKRVSECIKSCITGFAVDDPDAEACMSEIGSDEESFKRAIQNILKYDEVYLNSTTNIIKINIRMKDEEVLIGKYKAHLKRGKNVKLPLELAEINNEFLDEHKKLSVKLVSELEELNKMMDEKIDQIKKLDTYFNVQPLD